MNASDGRSDKQKPSRADAKEKASSPSGRSTRVNWWLGTVVTIVLAAIVYLSGRTGLLSGLELKSYDARFMLRGPVSVEHSDIIVVAVDDETFATMPSRWPFPRSVYSRMIENLFAAGARMIVFDIQFTEPSENPVEDQILAEATAKYKDRIIHAGKIFFRTDSRIDAVLTEAMLPTEVIDEAGGYVGIVNQLDDPDGFTRQYPLYIEHAGTNYLALATKAAQLDAGLSQDVPFIRGEEMVEYGPYDIPLQVSGTVGTMLINYYGPAQTFPTYSLSDVLDDEEFDLRKDDTDYMKWYLMPDAQFELLMNLLPEEASATFREMRASNPFKDKIVFVGATAAELQDLKLTPFYTFFNPDGKVEQRMTPGVECHANAFQSILDRNFIKNVPPVMEFAVVFLIMFAIFALNNSVSLLVGTLLSILMAVVYTFFNIYLFLEHHIWLAAISPLSGMFIAYLATTVYQVIMEQREKRMIRGMFSQYVPKKVVEQLIENPDMLRLGGERRRMSVLFTDVAGFTSMSEKMEPEEIVQLLNEYLSEMSNIILDNEGIIDKYEGDLIMAEWGAPVFFEDHAAHACRAALIMKQRLGEMRTDWRQRGMPPLFARIGINTGFMLVGNMGCLEVFDYTVMGDAVNLASRLEGANKSYGSTIMIGPETQKDVDERGFVTRMLDDIRVKGKAEPVRVYELLAESKETLPERKKDVVPVYMAGLEAYREMRFDDGIEQFKKALNIDPDDGPSETYLKRCEYYHENPPDEAWDRVFELTEK
jgi:adenylate cyclase